MQSKPAAGVQQTENDGYSSEDIPLTQSGSKRKKRSQLESSESDEPEEVSESEEEEERGRSGRTATARILSGLTREKAKGKERRSEKDSADGKVMSELKEMNKILLGLSDRLKKTEKRMKTMEEKITSPGPSSSSSSGICLTPKSSRKKDVPQEVRVSFTYAWPKPKH